MPSDSLPHPSSSGPEQPLAESDAGASTLDTTATASAQRGRHNRYVRFHAAQSLIFFLTIPLAQLALFIALVVVGNIVGISALAFVLGVLFIGAFVALGIGALVLWLWMLADCWAGQATSFPILGSLAHRLERLLTEVRREVASSRTVRQNGMV